MNKPRPTFSRISALPLVVALTFYSGLRGECQTASPSLDLDRSGFIDRHDYFLFSSVWYDLYDIGPRNFNILDYFVIDFGNRWHYVENGAVVSDEDFQFRVQPEPQPLPSGLEAFRILNDFDTNLGAREGIEDFWRPDENGNLFYEGTSFDQPVSLGGTASIPPQTVYLSEPVLFGKADQEIGEAIMSTATTEIMAEANGSLFSITAEAISEVVPTAFLPTLQTELGVFTDVLRVRFDVTLRLFVLGGSFNFNFINSTVFFKKDIGPIAIDFSPDIQDAGVLTIDEGSIIIDGTPTVIVAQ